MIVSWPSTQTHLNQCFVLTLATKKQYFFVCQTEDMAATWIHYLSHVSRTYAYAFNVVFILPLMVPFLYAQLLAKSR